MIDKDKAIVKCVELACLSRARREGLLDDEEFMKLTAKVKKKYRITENK